MKIQYSEKFSNLQYILYIFLISFLSVSTIFAAISRQQLLESDSLSQDNNAFMLVAMQEKSQCLEVVIENKDKFSLDISLLNKACLSKQDSLVDYQKFYFGPNNSLRTVAWSNNSIIQSFRDKQQCLTLPSEKPAELQRVVLADCIQSPQQDFRVRQSMITPNLNTTLCLGFDLLNNELVLRNCGENTLIIQR